MTLRILAALALVSMIATGVWASTIDNWSTTAASNNASPPDGFPENMLKSDVNDAARELMASVRKFWDAQRHHENLLMNGGMRVWQRGTLIDATTDSQNNDDTYTADRWILLSDGNDIADISEELTVVPTGSYSAMRLDVETANKKFGIAQILEARDSEMAIGGTVSLSFKARTSAAATIGTLRAGVLSWFGSEDVVTSDMVSSWQNAGVDPTVAGSWVFENTPSALTLSGSAYTTFKVEGVSVDTTGANNLAVFIWVDDTDATVGDFLYITDVQLERKASASDFYPRPFAEELALCQRFYAKTFPYGTAPDANQGVFGALNTLGNQNTGKFLFQWRYPQEMRATPTVTTYNPVASASAEARNFDDNTNHAVTEQLGGSSGTSLVSTVAAPTGNQNDTMIIHAQADAEL